MRSRAGSRATATSTCGPTWRRCAGSRGSRRRRSCSATSTSTTARRCSPSPRQVLKAQMERAAALGFTPMMGSELEFYLLRETFEEAHAKEYSGLTPVGAVHPRLPHPRDDLRRGVPAPDPERHAGRRDARRDVEGRGLAGPAGDQLPLRRRADDGGQPRHLQERRQGDRVPERLLDHVHGEAVPGLDRQLVPHPLVALARRRRRASRPTRRCSRAGSPARSRASRSSRSSSRRRSTRTSGSPPARGRRRRSRGGTTTARAGSASSGTGRRAGRRRGSPAATRTRTSRSRP